MIFYIVLFNLYFYVLIFMLFIFFNCSFAMFELFCISYYLNCCIVMLWEGFVMLKHAFKKKILFYEF